MTPGTGSYRPPLRPVKRNLIVSSTLQAKSLPVVRDARQSGSCSGFAAFYKNYDH
jgi:hypothetical protein